MCVCVCVCVRVRVRVRVFVCVRFCPFECFRSGVPSLLTDLITR